MLGEEDQSRNPASGDAVASAVFRLWACFLLWVKELMPVIAGRLMRPYRQGLSQPQWDQVRDNYHYLPRDPTTTNPMPPIKASALRIGEIGIVSFCLCWICTGPRSTSFF